MTAKLVDDSQHAGRRRKPGSELSRVYNAVDVGGRYTSGFVISRSSVRNRGGFLGQGSRYTRPSVCSWALHSKGRSIRRISAITLKSGGCRPSTIASTTLGDKNPSGRRRRTDRRSSLSRLAISSTDRAWPEISSSDHLRARATALSMGRSILLGPEPPSSTNRSSTPRRFICSGTNLARLRWLGFTPL